MMENFKKTNDLHWVKGKIEGFQGKNLIEMENGSLKMIKVDAFATYPYHAHPKKTEYIYILEGRPEITIEEDIYIGEKGDFFILPNTCRHRIANLFVDPCLILVGSIGIGSK